jgi:glycine cleavage system regulatory protein
MHSLVITVIGPDRPGLVRALSEQATRFGANWTDSVMANFAGQFAGIVHLQVPPEHSGELQAALRAIDSDNLHIQVARADGQPAVEPPRRITLALVGHDRPGIIQSIATRLAEHGVSIDTMKTHIASGAMSGEEMFHLDARLTIPGELDTELLQAGLESLANELMVDITLVGGKNAADAGL